MPPRGTATPRARNICSLNTVGRRAHTCPPRVALRVQLPTPFPVHNTRSCGSTNGLPSYWMEEYFVTDTFLLDVKECQPGKDVSVMKAGKALPLWAGQVLEEYGLR